MPSAVSWPHIKLSIAQLKHGSVPGRDVGETSHAKGTLQHMQSLTMAKYLCAQYITTSVHGWKKSEVSSEMPYKGVKIQVLNMW